MSAKPIETVDLRSRREWRKWLKEHYQSKSEIWLLFHKRHTDITSISYDDAVEEALCFGWIDSIIKRLDDDRYARKFTPRRAGSAWSELNKARAEKMIAEGRMTDVGLALIAEAKASGEWDREHSRPPVSQIPSYIEQRLKSDPRAWQYFKGLAPSYQRAYIGWIDSAKRQETKEKRLGEAMELLAAGKKLGLK